MKYIITIAILVCSILAYGQEVLRSDSVRVEFTSEAPLELISASSESCSGALDTSSNQFAFKIRLRSFNGFNSPLQKEHFNENYIESDKYPEATFTGRLLDPISNAKTTVRAKGQFNIHGVSKEQLVDIEISKAEDGSLLFSSEFLVELEDHNISVPRIVYQKISETIEVNVSGVLH